MIIIDERERCDTKYVAMRWSKLLIVSVRNNENN